jgi:hypothetical protein
VIASTHQGFPLRRKRTEAHLYDIICTWLDWFEGRNTSWCPQQSKTFCPSSVSFTVVAESRLVQAGAVRQCAVSWSSPSSNFEVILVPSAHHSAYMNEVSYRYENRDEDSPIPASPSVRGLLQEAALLILIACAAGVLELGAKSVAMFPEMRARVIFVSIVSKNSRCQSRAPRFRGRSWTCRRRKSLQVAQ